MPTLEFKGMQFVYSHHLSVPFRELQVEPEKSLPAEGRKPWIPYEHGVSAKKGSTQTASIS
ncbi:MAG: hypothetical protein J0652_00900 [Desulfobulbaceae bacterium]|nr:hypothetical protein [Desulfobulbaceae bacterium]